LEGETPHGQGDGVAPASTVGTKTVDSGHDSPAQSFGRSWKVKPKPCQSS